MTITPGTPFSVNGSGASPVAVGVLDANNAVAMYRQGTTHKANVVQDDETVGADFSFAGTGNTGKGQVAMAGLSSTSAVSFRSRQATGAIARVLSRSGTTLTAPGADVDLGGSDPGGLSITALSSTGAIAVWSDDNNSNQGTANYLSISGSTITDESSVVFDANNISSPTAVLKLTTTKAVAVYRDVTDSNQLQAVVLSVTGVTISAGTPVTIDAGDSCQHPALASISTTSALLTYRNVTDNDVKSVVLSGMSGTTVTVNSPIIVDGTDGDSTALAGYSATEFVCCYTRTGDVTGRAIQLDVTGVTVATSGSNLEFDANSSDNSLIAYDATKALNFFEGTAEGVIITLSAAGLGLAPMFKPADIDAAGTFIYVALLEGSTPILSKISTALDSDGTTVFDPGAGDNIGVECGRFNADVVWVAGNFDGTNVVEKSEDAGSSFTVKDDGTIGDVRAFVMGPDSDDKLLVFDETNGDILETRDDGASWDSINASVTPEVNAIGRLGKNVEESAFGNQGAANDNVNYSVNSGADLEDFNLPVNADVTRVIVN